MTDAASVLAPTLAAEKASMEEKLGQENELLSSQREMPEGEKSGVVGTEKEGEEQEGEEQEVEAEEQAEESASRARPQSLDGEAGSIAQTEALEGLENQSEREPVASARRKSKASSRSMKAN